jgi:radical SAM/Cys-rich protein
MNAFFKNNKFKKTLNFAQTLEENQQTLFRKEVSVLQINMGKICNQVCKHCHIDASPNQLESMEYKTVERIVEIIKTSPEIKTVDITGGAPEMNPNFRYLISNSKLAGKKILTRCNLTILLESGQEDTINFFKQNGVEVISSLPCYGRENVDAQRGRNVFDKSVTALRKLNEAGFGITGSGLILNLVYNPGGYYLPSNQKCLEKDYKIRLKNDFNIEFNHLFTITNMPIKRFLTRLKKDGELENYYNLLADNFNPEAAKNAMCKEMISLSWDGKIYDCDFNQALDLPLSGKIRDIWQMKKISDLANKITIANHCYGCTAGAGSSCGGAIG